jgi:hypothetical protein
LLLNGGTKSKKESFLLESKEGMRNVNQTNLVIVIAAQLAVWACGQSPPSSKGKAVDSKGVASTPGRSECISGELSLKDQADVDRLRGIDFPESNFRVVGCRDKVDSLSDQEKSLLANELDRLVNADRAEFKRQSLQPEYRLEVTNRLNALLRREVVQDWAADLWEMTY